LQFDNKFVKVRELLMGDTAWFDKCECVWAMKRKGRMKDKEYSKSTQKWECGRKRGKRKN